MASLLLNLSRLSCSGVLRYGVKSDSAQTEQYEINYPLLRKVAKQISVDFANVGF